MNKAMPYFPPERAIVFEDMGNNCLKYPLEGPIKKEFTLNEMDKAFSYASEHKPVGIII